MIQKQTESLAARDRQIDELIGMLKDQIQEYKKAVARLDGNAASAACRVVGCGVWERKVPKY